MKNIERTTWLEQLDEILALRVHRERCHAQWRYGIEGGWRNVASIDHGHPEGYQTDVERREMRKMITSR
ncbi:hypothetical protein [Polaromonas sp.]|uniref:hypothetical protein n=1 Tax=Polaromonas sp. TaxID=1869339 RepID=UPI0025F26612|nr:hypothetical protein [Polaromonas sp.]